MMSFMKNILVLAGIKSLWDTLERSGHNIVVRTKPNFIPASHKLTIHFKGATLQKKKKTNITPLWGGVTALPLPTHPI